ncbi:ICMT-domain-containing protein [Gyrodon lividus]|nr:ICMT-domain-containing protein [Gyrodon lividus]
MSLLKVPILAPSLWLFNVAFTSPNAPPDRLERISGGPFYERVCPAVFPILQKLSASIPCVAELAVLLAVNYPSTLSSKILSGLVLSDQLPTFSLNRYFVAGSILVITGSLGRLWCFRALGRHFTHQLALRKDHQLITTGPYAIVRHPGYLFATISALGMSLIIASPGSFTLRCGWLETAFGKAVIGIWAMQNVLGWVLSYARTKSEDGMLRVRFREEWDSYSQRVRYRLVPGVF